jgi:hypothetical protein
MSKERLSDYIERYGEPILRYFPEKKEMGADTPNAIYVFRIPHPSKIMIVSRYWGGWHFNSGCRALIDHLMRRLK